MPDKSKTVEIWDGGQGKSLMLEPAEKRATVYNYANMPKDKTAQRRAIPWPGFARCCSMPGINRTSNASRSARRTSTDAESSDSVSVALRVVLSVWGDPKTGLPVRIEMTMAIMPNMKITMSDFEFNVDMDESLFSVEPPAGYEVIAVQDHAIDDSPAEEKDLIEMFRYYSELSGGRFPDLLDMEWLNEVVTMAGVVCR